MIIVSRYGSTAPDETALITSNNGLNLNQYSAFSEGNKRGKKIIDDYGDSYLISSVIETNRYFTYFSITSVYFV